MPTPEQLQTYLSDAESSGNTIPTDPKEASRLIERLKQFSYARCECCFKPNQWVNGQGLCLECFMAVWQGPVNEAVDSRPDLIQLQADRILFNDFCEHIKNE